MSAPAPHHFREVPLLTDWFCAPEASGTEQQAPDGAPPPPHSLQLRADIAGILDLRGASAGLPPALERSVGLRAPLAEFATKGGDLWSHLPPRHLTLAVLVNDATGVGTVKRALVDEVQRPWRVEALALPCVGPRRDALLAPFTEGAGDGRPPHPPEQRQTLWRANPVLERHIGAIEKAVLRKRASAGAPPRGVPLSAIDDGLGGRMNCC